MEVKRKTPGEIVAILAEHQRDDALRQLIKEHIREEHCETKDCDRFDQCDVAQHDCEELRKYVWKQYARLN